MSDYSKYITDYSWKTIVRNIIVLSETTYQVSVYPIDSGDSGALLPIQVGFILVDNAGHIFKITSVNDYDIIVEDSLLCGENPVSGMTGIVCKTANKGRSILIPQGQLNYLDKTAKHYLDSIVWSILWANDPNALRVPFVSATPELTDYQNTYAEDYGENPKIQLFTIDESGNEIERTEKSYRQLVDGLIDSIVFGELPDGEQTGYILISK